ncbi:MAG: RluA family pseudouridine synthase [Candidatus Binatia bacterium]|nr:RluA family pseudouridine synthase [Candidatus Binatia bacterium]
MAGELTQPSRGIAERVQFEVSSEDGGLRLDQLIAKHVPGLSRRKARLLIELGGAFVDCARVKVLGRKLWPGQKIEVHLGGAIGRVSPGLGAAALQRDGEGLPHHGIVHEDAHVVVVDKPSGLLTTPMPESDRNNLLDLLERRTEPPTRAWPVNRLDTETSGLLVFGKTELATRALSERFRTHDVDRQYLAVVHGAVPASLRRIEEPIDGQPAASEVAVLQPAAGATVVRVRTETGRTHQVRIHMAGAGHSVCGDRRYGERGALEPPRMALHATRLGFVHPENGERMVFESRWPADLSAWIAGL